MGLGFSHSGGYWAYGRFHEFRTKLAADIGINLEEMRGFDGKKSWEGCNDAIAPLLYHADDDGILTPEECCTIAPRLRELVFPWKEDENLYRYRALELAKAMDRAALANENLEFR